MKRISLAAALCLVAGTAAHAQLAYEPGFYGALQGGINIAPGETAHVNGFPAHQGFKVGPSGGGALGYTLGGGFRVEADTLFSHSAIRGGGGDRNALSLMGNVLYDFDIGTSFTPYIGAGAGYVRIADNALGDHDSEWRPGYQLRGGFAKQITDTVGGFVEYRWQHAKSASLDLSGNAVRQPFSNNGVLLGAKMNF